MDWKRIINNPAIDNNTKIKRVVQLIDQEFGAASAGLFNGAVINYTSSGTDFTQFNNSEIEEAWKEVKNLVDDDRAGRAKKKRGSTYDIAFSRGQMAAGSKDEPAAECEMEFDEELLDINKACGLASRITPEEGGRYVSDVIDMNEIVSGKLNIICSPPGSGKTTFIEGALKEYAKQFSQELLYLAPIRALVEAVKRRGEPKTYSLPNGIEVTRWKQDGITAMTYAAFGSIIARKEEDGSYRDAEWWHDDALICLDELSSAVQQANYTNPKDKKNVTARALDELVQRCKEKTNTVVTLSATPRAAVDHFFFRNGVDIHVVRSTLGLKGYENGKTITYQNLDSLLKGIDPNLRGMIYAKSIETIKRIVALLNERGIKAVGIWSDSNADKPMDKEQKEVAAWLIQYEAIPDGIQVLVFNSAYEIGLNIRPEKSHLDYAVVHNSNKETIIQARGRYRGDIDVLYCLDSGEKQAKEVRKIDDSVLEPYLDKKLDKRLKNKLREDVGFRDNKNRLIGWPKLAEEIRGNGYLVVDKRSKSSRCSMIFRESGKAEEE